MILIISRVIKVNAIKTSTVVNSSHDIQIGTDESCNPRCLVVELVKSRTLVVNFMKNAKVLLIKYLTKY